MHILSNEKEAINLKEIKEGYTGGFRGRKGREKYWSYSFKNKTNRNVKTCC